MAVKDDPKAIAKLLRAMAKSEHGQCYGWHVILNAAANLLDATAK
jgi:hypothetical protein